MSRPFAGNRGPDFGSKATTGIALGTCGLCGKYAYETRAKVKSRARLQAGQKLNIYRCGDYWHMGHLPQSVRNGALSKTDYEATKRGTI